MQAEQTSEQRQTKWSDMDWAAADAAVKRQQGRIHRAAAAGKLGQVKNLQKLLVSSTFAKRLAVRTVTQQNAGRNTPGIDGVVCRTPEDRMRLADVRALRWKRHRLPCRNDAGWASSRPSLLLVCGQAILADRREPGSPASRGTAKVLMKVSAAVAAM